MDISPFLSRASSGCIHCSSKKSIVRDIILICLSFIHFLNYKESRHQTAKEEILLNDNPAAFLLYISTGQKNNPGLNKPPQS